MHYHGYRHALGTIKMLPQKPDILYLADIFQRIARLGMFHPVLKPITASQLAKVL
jgi:hypothetical protein